MYELKPIGDTYFQSYECVSTQICSNNHHMICGSPQVVIETFLAEENCELCGLGEIDKGSFGR